MVNKISQFRELGFDYITYDSQHQVIELERFIKDLEGSYSKAGFEAALNNFENHRWLFGLSSAHPTVTISDNAFTIDNLIELFRNKYNELADVPLGTDDFETLIFNDKLALFELLKRLLLNSKSNSSYLKTNSLQTVKHDFEAPSFTIVPEDIDNVEVLINKCEIINNYLSIDLYPTSTIFFSVEEGDENNFSTIFNSNFGLIIRSNRNQIVANDRTNISVIGGYRFIAVNYEKGAIKIYYFNEYSNIVDYIYFTVLESEPVLNVDIYSDVYNIFTLSDELINGPKMNEIIAWYQTLPLNQINELVRSGRG